MTDTYEQVRDAIRRQKRVIMQMRAAPSVLSIVNSKKVQRTESIINTGPMFTDAKLIAALLRVEITWSTFDDLLCSAAVGYNERETLRAGSPMSIEGVRIYTVDFPILGGFNVINPFGKAP